MTERDIDIWVDMTAENASKIIKALDQFGFGSLGVKEAEFTMPGQMLQLAYPPGRIDILTTLPGVEFVGAAHAGVDLFQGAQAGAVQ